MSHNLKIPEVELAVTEIRNLKSARAEAEAIIADCVKKLAIAEEKLDSLRAEPKTTVNAEYLKAANVAWRASIEAYEASISAYQADVDTYTSTIESILKRIPEARLDH